MLFSLVLISVSQAQVVSIPDPNLAAAIREKIGNSITKETLLNLTHLEVRNRGIEDLTGLEHAHHLRQLDLGGVPTSLLKEACTQHANETSLFNAMGLILFFTVGFCASATPYCTFDLFSPQQPHPTAGHRHKDGYIDKGRATSLRRHYGRARVRSENF